MNADIYAEWLRRQGQHVIRTATSYWQGHGLGVYQAFPYHWLIQPSREELRTLMFRHSAMALRFSSPADEASCGDSYHAVYLAAGYDFQALTTKARNNVRRGLRSCTIEPIPFARYAEEGWELRVDTLARQHRRLNESHAIWRSRTWAAANLEGFEVWAAQVQGKLAATVIIFQMDDWFYLVYQQCHRRYLRDHVNNALSFVVTQNLNRRPKTRGIYYGMQSLDAPLSVDEFKFHMGYHARPVHQRVVFHPCGALLVTPLTHRLSQALLKWDPENRQLAKAEGMLRLGLMEKKPSFSRRTGL